MMTKTRRTPEQLAHYHQDKANKARAKATKLKNDAEKRAQMELSKVAVSAGINSGHELQAHLVLAQLMLKVFTHDNISYDDQYYLSGLTALFKPDPQQREVLYSWWTANNLPLGPERTLQT